MTDPTTVEPTTPLCRGCAGIGIGQHVPPRIIQIIGQGREDYVWSLRGPGIDRYLKVDSHVQRGRGVVHGPFAVVLAAYLELVDKGYELKPGVPVEPRREWACEWCHGTGQPALSVGSMELALRHIPINDEAGGTPADVYPDQLNAP